MRIHKVHVAGFKSIWDQTIDLGRVNCFIGANGAGKGNVLEAIGILSAASAGRVDDESIVRRGVRPGLPRLYKSSFDGERIPPHILLEARGHTPDAEAAFRVTLLNPLEKPEPAWSFKTEVLESGGIEVVSRGVRSAGPNLDPSAGLSALKVVELPKDHPAAALMRCVQGYSIYTPNTPTLRGTVPDPQSRNPVGLAGGGIADGFEALRESVPVDVLEEVMELIDWIADASTTENAGSLLSSAVPRPKNLLKFTDRYMSQSRNSLTAYDASEGSLYIIFAAILCLTPSSPALLAIDNLDSALNPRLVTRLIERLTRWLRERAPARQLLFTAHNPSVLDGLDLAAEDVRLFAVERNSKGHTVIRRIVPSEELLRMNSEYPLSRLWTTGNLGAVPKV